MPYRVRGLDPDPFRPLFALDDAGLAAAGARRVTADECPGYPCRVSLGDASMGERLILVSHPHMTIAGSPYRAAGPNAVEGFRRVMLGLIDERDRGKVAGDSTKPLPHTAGRTRPA